MYEVSQPKTAKKPCPRCGGNLLVTKDMRELVLKCLQCSRTYPIEKIRQEVFR